MSDVQCNCNGGESSLTCPRCNPGGERIRLFASLPHPAGSPEAIEIIWKDRDAWKARAEAAEKDAAFHKMSAMAFEDLHEAAEKRAREAEQKLAYRHAIDDTLEANRDIVEALAQHDRIERETIAAIVALLRDMASRWSEEGETKAEWIECTLANAEMLEYWRPKGREGGE